MALSRAHSLPEGRRWSVSVVIPTHSLERWPLLKRAVESVRAQIPPPSEVIICVDHNPDLSARCRREWGCEDGHQGPPVRVADSRYAGRWGASRTTAAELACGEFLLFLDDDAAATEGWLRRMLANFDDPSVLAVGGAPLPEYMGPRPRWFPPEFDWVFGCAYRGLPEVTAPARPIGT
ncbi:MAG: glycosyltransferase family 2 protein, partial [Candidatus Dormibacteraeota bacterium]|nr:glycosyltransferase family 2 protein [Candidatus Dormibacteraeota bacterium]